MSEPMSRIDVLREVCKTVQRLNGEARPLTVYEVADDENKALSPRTWLLCTIVRTGNVQHVDAGADVVVLHAQRADVLQAQIAHLLAIGVGFIVVPNTNPAEEVYQTHPCASTVWTGNGWRAVVEVNLLGLRYVATIEDDHGTSVLFPSGWRDTLGVPELSDDVLCWSNLVEYRAVWLGLVVPSLFAELLAGPVASSAPETSTTVDVQPETTEAPAEVVAEVAPELPSPPEPTTTPAPQSTTPTRRRRTRGAS